MSKVTSLILTGLFSDEAVHKIEDVFRKKIGSVSGIPLRDNAIDSMGSKAMQSDVYLMAFDYFPTEKFVEELNKILREAERESYAQLFVMEEHEDFFHPIVLDCKEEER